jgi:hypothetical protein
VSVVQALERNVGTCCPMQREKAKRDGATCSSDEVAEKQTERRGCVIQL